MEDLTMPQRPTENFYKKFSQKFLENFCIRPDEALRT